MDLFKQGMKGPSRPAPSIPCYQVNRYSPVSNWNDDPFESDVFEPATCNQRKKPPPRPPPPRLNPDAPARPSHFARKQTVLSSLLTRKKKATQTSQNIPKSFPIDFSNDVDPVKLFPKCEPKHVQTASLIDLSSPPSSPTFTTKSSSDGLSVDSFGSDATNSTNHHTTNGNASQAESGFEDDFDLFLNTRRIARDDTLDDFNNVDPFSPPALARPPVTKKPARNDYMVLLCNGKSQNSTVIPLHQGPTIIRAKPARPKPPDNTAILKSTLGNNITFPTMNLNTTPIQKISFDNDFNSKPLSWDDSSPEREESPPMPSCPPPPPPVVEDEHDWLSNAPLTSSVHSLPDDEEPHAIALFDYYTDHEEDLCFSANARIKLLRRENEEWLYGSLRSGAQGLFPSNYVEIKVPLPNEKVTPSPTISTADVLYDFEPCQPGDLKLMQGDRVTILYKLSDEWYFGEVNGEKGQFPANYVHVN